MIPSLLQELLDPNKIVWAVDAERAIKRWNAESDRDSLGNGLFHYACALDEQMAVWLLEFGIEHKREQIQLDLRRENQEKLPVSPFHHFINNYKTRVIKVAMREGVADLQTLNWEGKNALQMAESACHLEPSLGVTARKLHLFHKMKTWEQGDFSDDEERDLASELEEMLQESKREFPQIVGELLKIDREICTNKEELEKKSANLKDLEKRVDELKALTQKQATIDEQIEKLKELLAPKEKLQKELAAEEGALLQMRETKRNLQIQRVLLAQELYGLKTAFEEMQLIKADPTRNPLEALFKRDEEQVKKMEEMRDLHFQHQKKSEKLSESIQEMCSEIKEKEKSVALLTEELSTLQEKVSQLQRKLKKEKEAEPELKKQVEVKQNLESFDPFIGRLFQTVAQGTLKELVKYRKMSAPLYLWWQEKSLLSAAGERLKATPTEEAIEIVKYMILQLGHVSDEERKILNDCPLDQELKNLVTAPERNSNFYNVLKEKKGMVAYEALKMFRGDPNFKDENGDRLLHLAIRCEDPSLVQALLQKGADKELPNGAGNKPIELPESEGAIKAILLTPPDLKFRKISIPESRKPRKSSSNHRKYSSTSSLPPFHKEDEKK